MSRAEGCSSSVFFLPSCVLAPAPWTTPECKICKASMASDEAGGTVGPEAASPGVFTCCGMGVCLAAEHALRFRSCERFLRAESGSLRLIDL